MPGYSIENLLPEPILLLTLNDTWDLRAHMADLLHDWAHALDTANGQMTAIIDVRSPALPGLDDIIWGANQGARGANAVVKHPAMRDLFVVSTNPVLNMAARGLRADAFGNARVTVFPSVDKALAQARSTD